MDQALKVLDSPETFIAASDGKITPEMQEYVLEYILEELKKIKTATNNSKMLIYKYLLLCLV